MNQEEIDRVVFIEGNITDGEHLAQTVAQHNITHVIHLAGLQVPSCKANPRQGALVNVIGTINVFEAAKKFSGQVRRIVYASSAAVFGPEEVYDTDIVTNDAELKPTTHYGVFKQCNEGNARIYFLDDGISSIGLRPYAVYGVGRDVGITSDPTKAMKAAMMGKPYHIKFSGRIDMQFVDDVAKTFIQCAEVTFEGAKSYNLRGTVVSVEEIVSVIEDVVPSAKGRITFGGNAVPIISQLDNSKLIADIGDVPKTPLVVGVERTVAIFRRLMWKGRLAVED
jgi:nucleoside-diphosphate-sugar epimerase